MAILALQELEFKKSIGVTAPFSVQSAHVGEQKLRNNYIHARASIRTDSLYVDTL